MNNKQEILDELKILSPALFTTKKKVENIVVPEQYFSQFSDVFFAEMDIEFSILNTIPKENINIPEGYFEQFEESIVSKIQHLDAEMEIKSNASVPLFSSQTRYLFSRFVAAASLLGVFIFGIQQLKIKSLPNEQLSIAKEIEALSQEEIFQYISTNSYRFSTDQIQKMVAPSIETSEETVSIDINPQDAKEYLEQNIHLLDLEDASMNIF